MQNCDPPPAQAGGSHSAHPAQQTNIDLLSCKHPAIQPANIPSLQSSGLISPRRSDAHRSPSSSKPPSLALRRGSSVADLNRAYSPALSQKASTTSLRGDTPGTPGSSLSCRSSVQPNFSSPIGPRSPLPPPHEEKIALRACDVAEEYFEKDVARHGTEQGKCKAGTIVIIHDQCYGHRYSRPKTSKSTLALIMERPERILATVLGISAAYVRLGGRYAGAHHAPHPDHSLPESIPFTIRKTSRLVDITSQVVTNVHGTAWMAELQSLCNSAERKLASTGKELSRDGSVVMGPTVKRELHAGDLYLCPESMNAFQGALGGVLDAVDAIFQPKEHHGPSRAFVCIRPPGHHCSDDYPSGFCWLNNVHIGIEHAMMKHGLTHAAIIDFDLHHGDGSQAIAWARNKRVQNMSKNTSASKKTSIGYFSLHDINSYPCEDGDDDKVQAASLCIDNAHGQSVWNVHLQPWRTVEEFWTIYEEQYMILLDKTRLYLEHHTKRLKAAHNHPAPKAAIFLSAGFDASEWETAGMQRHSVNVPTEFYARFTRDVVRLSEEVGTAVEGRVISVLEGGYSDRALTSGVLSHLSGLCDGQIWKEYQQHKGLTFEMSRRLAGLNLTDGETASIPIEPERRLAEYDPSWWHASQLAELENLVNPAPVAPKKPLKGPAHFSSPTQSFTAKVVDATKLSRKPSGKFQSRANTPPPPDVGWATAALALSKLLIPADRQTRSYRAEDLAEVKIKKERMAAPSLGSNHIAVPGRQLRGRKAVTLYADPKSDEENIAAARKEARSSRRKTIADFPIASTEPAAPTRITSRRMSIASSVSSIGDREVARAPNVTGRRSVAPTTAPTGGVAVKKARTSTSTTTNVRAAQRPPVPRVPSGYKAKAPDIKNKDDDDVEALTTGLKRITLKLPSREEYEAREKEKAEKQKALEAAKKAAAKTAARKTPTARVLAAKTMTTKATTTKKGPGRPTRITKPDVDPQAFTLTPEQPKPDGAAGAPSEPGFGTQADSRSLLKQVVPQPGLSGNPLINRLTSASPTIGPPTEVKAMQLTPEQLCEHSPMPSINVAQSVEGISPPSRAETPPLPPSGMPQFINYTSGSFGNAVDAGMPTMIATEPQAAGRLQWMPLNTNSSPPSANDSRPLSPVNRRNGLPVFTSNSTIPFAANSQAAPLERGLVTSRVSNFQAAAPQVKQEQRAKDV